MLASPLYPPSFSPQQPSDEPSQYRPAKDLEDFNRRLPPRVEFVEGSSSGTLVIAEGKYEPINGSPKAARQDETSRTAPSTPAAVPRPKTPAPTSAKSATLFSGSIDTSWPRGVTVAIGLNNTGNTCFLNSALQCLLHTTPVLNVLKDHLSDRCRIKNGFCMSCSLRELMVEVHAHKRHSITPFQITNRLQVIAKHMRRGRQEDSHEFLRYAIDALQKSCLAGQPPRLDPKIAETTWVHKIFGGKLRSRVTCSECHHPSDTFDNILDLSIDINNTGSVKEALRKFTAVDYLKGADKYKCEKCTRRVVAEKQFTVHEAPLVLTVHLKRFSPLGRKIGHTIRYDEHLSLSNAMSDGQYGPSYSLYGIISHAGGGPNSGHYYAHVRAANGQWFEMNDDSVTRHGLPLNMKNAYILFYMREKGQVLEAAVAAKAQPAPIVLRSVVTAMKKRKVLSDDEDEGVKQKRPFIGPVLPTAVPQRDPQADSLKKKIEAVSKPSKPLLIKPSTALSSLTQYSDESSEDDTGVKVSPPSLAKVSSPPPTQESQTATTPPASQTVPPSSPLAAPSTAAIPPERFYGNGSDNSKKRKSPDGDYGSLQRTPVRTAPSFVERTPLHFDTNGSTTARKPFYDSSRSRTPNRSVDSPYARSRMKSMTVYGKKRRPRPV